MTGNAATTTDLIELTGIRQRTDAYRFDLLDSALNTIGEVKPMREQPPTIELSTTSPIMRTVTGFDLDASQQADIDTVSARIRPMMILQNGVEFALGVLLFGDAPRSRRSWGLELSGTLVDAGYILNLPIGRVFGVAAGTNVVAAALAVAQEVITTPVSYSSSSQVVGAPLAWRPTDTRSKVINDLLALVGYLPVYFDNSGTLIMRPVPTLPVSLTDVKYAAGGRIIKDSILEADNLLIAPNRWVVYDTSATTSPVVGSYDLPASAPNSIARRGFPVILPIERQGIGSSDAAAVAAQAAANSDPSAFSEVSFESTHDPRHDAFNTVELLDLQYREVGWRVEARAGAKMRHSLRRVYS